MGYCEQEYRGKKQKNCLLALGINYTAFQTRKGKSVKWKSLLYQLVFNDLLHLEAYVPSSVFTAITSYRTLNFPQLRFYFKQRRDTKDHINSLLPADDAGILHSPLVG